jgi:hypothetical protein
VRTPRQIAARRKKLLVYGPNGGVASPGMPLKPITRNARIASIAAWASMLVVGFLEIGRSHGNPGFLPLLQIAVALMKMFSEVKSLIEEPTLRTRPVGIRDGSGDNVPQTPAHPGKVT